MPRSTNKKPKNSSSDETKTTIEVYDHVEVFYPSVNRWRGNWHVIEIKSDGYMCADHWHSEKPNSGELFSNTSMLRFFPRDRVRIAQEKPLPLKPNGWYKGYPEYFKFCQSCVGGLDHTPDAGKPGAI